MKLNEATDLGTTTDVFNNIQLFGFLFKIIFPIVVVLIVIELIKFTIKAFNYWLKQNEIKKKQLKEKEKQRQKQQEKINLTRQKRKQHIDKLYRDDNFLMKQLDGTHEPIDKSIYHDLDLFFDKSGKVIKH